MNRVEKFLEKYPNIRNEHKDLILDYHSFLKKYSNIPKMTSKFGTHFKSCPWADDTTTEGPDTCTCYYVYSYNKKLNDIIDWYERNWSKK